jgi:hypothetical protein
VRHEKARYYFDNSGVFADCYTVVYSRGVKLAPFHISYPYAGMGENPTGPQGIWQHGAREGVPIDNYGKHYADYKHLGHRITWSHLPQAIRTALEQEASA